MEKSKTVLVIDDSEPICDAVRDILSEIEIPVLTASDGQSGMQLYQTHQAEVGLILLDMVLPGMSGDEVLRELRLLSPRVPIILSTGYGASHVAQFRNDPNVSFLSKPFSFDDLVAKVDGMLNQHATQSE